MAKQGIVGKIYELRTLGFPDVHKELQQISRDFLEIKKAKREAEAALAKANDAEGIARHREEVNKLKIAEQELRVERQRMMNEARAEQQARQAAVRQAKEEAAATKAAAGSYQELYNQYRELYKLVKNAPKTGLISFQGQSLGYDEAVTKLKNLAAAEQDFRRQFAKDQTLVGEYTTGIVQAFKNMGLGDLIGGQITKADDKLQSLNQHFDQLRQEMKEARASGVGNLDAIEKALIDNRKEAIALQREVEHLRQDFRGVGDIGNQISTSIGKGFKDAKGMMAQFVLGYIGFQAAISGAQKAVALNFDFEDAANELKAITGVAAADLDFLKQKALETSNATKFSAAETLEAFKLIASAKPELLQNAQALNQVKDAAVTLAQASGQTLPEAVDSLTKILNQYGAGAEEAARYTDALAAGAKFGAAEIPAITAAILDFGSQAKSANISVQESVGLIELLAEKGIQGAEAGTKLRNVLLAMTAVDALPKNALDALQAAGVNLTKLKDTTIPLEERLKELAKIQNDNTAVVKVFGKENFNAAQIVLQNVPRYAQLAGQVKATGIAMEQASENTKGASTQWAILRNTLQNFVTSYRTAKFLSGLAAVLIFLFNNMAIGIPVLLTCIALTSTLAGKVVRLTAAALLDAAAWVIENAQIAISNGLKAAATTITAIYTAAVIRSTAATGAAAIAARVLAGAIAFLSSPIGLVLGLVVALTTVVGALSSSAQKAVGALNQLSAKQQALIEINRRANESYAQQMSVIDAWMKVIKDSATGADTKRVAMQKLIELHPEFAKALDGEKINLEKLEKAYRDVTTQIKAKAEAEAAAMLTAEKQKKYIETKLLRQRFEIIRGQGGSVESDDLTESERKILEDNEKLLVAQKGRDKIKFNALFQRVGYNITKENAQGYRDFFAKIESAALDEYQTYLDVQRKAQEDLAKLAPPPPPPGTGTGGGADGGSQTIADLKKQLATIIQGIQQLDLIKNKNSEQLARLKQLRRDKTEVERQIRELEGKKGGGASKLSSAQQDAFKVIDAKRDTALADEETSYRRGEQSEERYLQNILRINQEAIDKKLSLLKGKNAEELQTMAELRRDRVKLEGDTNDRIFAMRQQDLQRQLEQEVAALEERAQRVQDDPTASATAKAQAKLDADRAILALQERFNRDIDELEKRYGQQSVRNVKETQKAIRDTKAAINKDQVALDQAALADARKAGDASLAEFRRIIALQRLAIQQSNKSEEQKDKANESLDRQERFGILVREVSSMQIQLPIYKKLLDEKKITEEEYNNFVAQLYEKQRQMGEAQVAATEKRVKKIASLGDFIRQKISSLFKTDTSTEQGRAKQEVINTAIAQSYDLAAQAMHNFFDAERQRIQDNLALQLQRLDAEKKQVLGRAQSQAEIDSIEKQYATKKRKAEQEAHQQMKKSRKSEAKIALATELANIWATAWQLGPIAGAIAGVVLSGLAIGRHAIRVNEINREQFAYGGQPGRDVPIQGGEFGGSPHSNGGTPFAFRGRTYEAEVGELSIIRKKNAPANKTFTISGTHTQIASKLNELGGGRRFAPGAKLSRFEFGGNLGEGLQAPVFTPAQAMTVVNQSGVSKEDLDTMLSKMEDIVDATNKRIDRIQVQLVTSAVTDAQRKEVQQNAIGRL